MTIDRRELLAGLAATALASAWEAGEVVHSLPTANDRRILVKASFRRTQARTPFLKVDGRLIAGKPTDTGGLFWSFDADQLQPARPYNLQLLSAAKKALCAPWTLKTLPDPDDRPQRLRLLIYTCAGGDERLIANNGKKNYLSLVQRGRLLDRALSFQPDAVIANGDHVYWDLRQSTHPARYTASAVEATGKFVRHLPVLGTPNETVLRHVGDQQIANLYGTRLRGLPVFFLQDDHDYFENDDADDKMVTFPPDHFMLQLGRATRRLYYPEFLPVRTQPLGLPGSSAADTPAGTGESFGTLRFGRLAELLLYDCRRYLSLAGLNSLVIPREAEDWIHSRMADPALDHLVHIPSQPPGWSAGKWGDWYPDILAADGSLTINKPKPYWQTGWLAQHDRLMKAASAQRQRTPLFISGDMHSIAEGHISRSGQVDLRANPVVSILPGPLGTGQSWPSRARGVRAIPPHHLDIDEKQSCLEENGFLLLDFFPEKAVAKYFRWRPEMGDEAFATLAPFRETEMRRPS